jgi:hypothetical protein
MCFYWLSPLLGKLILLIVNCIVPDPIPLIDEIFMTLGLLINFNKIYETITYITNWLGCNKHLIIPIIIALILAFIFIIKVLIPFILVHVTASIIIGVILFLIYNIIGIVNKLKSIS